MVVLGGMGNFWGVAVGAFVIYTINNVVLKTLNQFFDTLGIPILEDIDFIQLQFLLYGIALVAMMLLRPEGLFPNSRRQRELHAQAAEGEAVQIEEEIETGTRTAEPGEPSAEPPAATSTGEDDR